MNPKALERLPSVSDPAQPRPPLPDAREIQDERTHTRFSYNPKKHVAHFSLYVPNTNGKLRRERTAQADSREEAIRLWQTFRAEISGRLIPAELPPQPRVITFATFVAEYLDRICARRAKKTLAIYRTITFTRLVPYFGERSLDGIQLL